LASRQGGGERDRARKWLGCEWANTKAGGVGGENKTQKNNVATPIGGKYASRRGGRDQAR